ncbi:MAG: hypothetical protein COB04_08320 [Gammaproteobacteria bacterium]|nr:MAG: hypothetical protein COB04_08320 [Gammaproteobacteria bacterium]
MINIQNTALLSLVKDELENTIRELEAHLEAFADEREDRSHLQFCVDTYHQLNGVFQLVGLPGASMLAGELEEASKYIPLKSSQALDEDLTLLGTATTILARYLSYVHITQKPLPQLLIPSINDLRVLRGERLIPDCTFFTYNHHSGIGSLVAEQDPSGVTPSLDQSKLDFNFARLRHMYQVGLLSVFQSKEPWAGLKMMTRAIQRISKLTQGEVSYPFWRLVDGVLCGFQEGNVSLNRERKIMLGQVDRQIKLQLLQQTSDSGQAPSELVKSCVYILTLAEGSIELITDLKENLELAPQSYSDVTVQAELHYMTGPDGSVINAVVTALKEELSQIKEWIDLAVRGKNVESYESLEAKLLKIGQTLYMVGLPKISEQIKSQVEKLSRSNSEDDTALTFEYDEVAEMLVKIENAAVSLMTEGAKKEQIDDSDIMSNKHVALSVLEQVNGIVVKESRAGLTLTKRAIMTYIDSEWDIMHLDNVPTTLNSVCGALGFLKLDRAALILTSCQTFIKDCLLSSAEGHPDPEILETLADALSSVDYYLESLEEKKPIGDGMLDVAEESMNELGFPVKAA